MQRPVCALLGALALASCASELRQLPPSLDPANPDAPESAPMTSSNALGGQPDWTPPEPAKGHVHHDGHAAQEPDAVHADHGRPRGQAVVDAGTTVYVCPMHPEVTSTDPKARCP